MTTHAIVPADRPGAASCSRGSFHSWCVWDCQSEIPRTRRLNRHNDVRLTAEAATDPSVRIIGSRDCGGRAAIHQVVIRRSLCTRVE
jgi:hypothetical protein